MSRIFGGRRTLVGPESDTHLASGNQCFGSESRLDQDSGGLLDPDSESEYRIRIQGRTKGQNCQTTTKFYFLETFTPFV